MDYTEAVTYLDAHIGLGVKPGLERISDLLEMMGSPHVGYPIIHIAGTNGKTSTVRMSSALLSAHGLRTGTYTSPHLQKVEERLGVDERFSTHDEFALAVSDVAAFADIRQQSGKDPNTYFELTTASAFAFFAEQAVSAAVVEVGLGGRLDATNVIDAEVCAVTSIAKDHTEYLGSEISDIAAEKLAIAGPSSILVTGQLIDDAAEVAADTAKRLGIQHRRLGKDFSVSHAERGVGGWMVDISGAEDTYEDVFLPVHGRHQIQNLALAVASVEALLGTKLEAQSIRAAASALTLPGRMEPAATTPLVLLDGAHNAAGVEALTTALREEFPTTRWQVVFGVMGDKDIDDMIARIAPLADGLVVTQVDYERAAPAEELQRRARAVTEVPVLLASDPEHALDMARAEAGPDGAVLVTGSLYLVGEARDVLGL
ncbi:MAG: folylpolyglutamate synthase/dihydrofolate synthase family protein [Acidimicrobiia bacterium]|nr:folylpolyglutamate synthase/dihydrofolate synthase family protein [Acidimicrobiia bacterium]